MPSVLESCQANDTITWEDHLYGLYVVLHPSSGRRIAVSVRKQKCPTPPSTTAASPNRVAPTLISARNCSRADPHNGDVQSLGTTSLNHATLAQPEPATAVPSLLGPGVRRFCCLTFPIFPPAPYQKYTYLKLAQKCPNDPKRPYLNQGEM